MAPEITMFHCIRAPVNDSGLKTRVCKWNINHTVNKLKMIINNGDVDRVKLVKPDPTREANYFKAMRVRKTKRGNNRVNSNTTYLWLNKKPPSWDSNPQELLSNIDKLRVSIILDIPTDELQIHKNMKTGRMPY
ncbi:hypothetical protein V6N13_073263 [Hibiscus sabdariffa]